MCRILIYSFFLVLLLAPAGSVSAALPAGWTGLDIADPAFATAGTSQEVGGTWTLTASGNDVWGNDDEFHFCHTTLRGDGELIARVATITGGTNNWRKAGVMIRNELAHTSVHAHIVGREGGDGGSFQWRPVAGAGSSSSSYGDPDIPVFIKIVREGNSFSGYTSPDGATWTQRGNTVEIDMATNVYVGLSLTSHNRDEITTATYDNVQLFNPGLNQALEPDPADGAMVSPWVEDSNLSMSLDYSPGPDAVSYTGYFSDSFDDVNDRVADANLGSPPWPESFETAFFVGSDSAEIPEFARASLVRGKTYFWAVDIWDGLKTNYGQVWSFTVKPEKAYDPVPLNGASFVPIDPNLTVSWTMGDVDPDGNSVSYDVFYGTDAVAVAAATVPDMNVSTTSALIGPLANGTSYAWRIDTVLTQTNPPFPVRRVQGEVWQFETLPVIPITDPNLQGWWKFDVGSGTTAIDWSGHGRDGTLIGPSPTWAPGVLGNALEFDGSDNSYVNIDGYKGVLGTSAFSVAAWVKSTATGDRTIMSWGTGTSRERVDFRLYQGRLRVEHGAGNRQGDTVLADDEWHHAALTVAENATISYPEVRLWLDGQDDTRSGTDPDAFNLVAEHDLGIGIRVHNDQREFLGALDDVRLYDKELTAGDISQILDPARAWDPSPADGDKDVALGTKLTWKPGADPDTGIDFTTHHLYFSTSFEDVNSESIAPIPLTGVTEHAPTLEYYGRYFWKVNEVGSSVVKGNIWTFKVTHDPAQVVDPNLKAWYKMDGDGSDSSGYGNHAEPLNPAFYVPSDDGEALQLFGDNFLEATDYTGVTGTHSRTLAAWIKTTSFGEIMSWGQDTTSLKWIFRVQESNGTLGAIRIEVNGGYIVGSFDVRDNEWHHVAAVLQDDGSPMVGEIKLYVDGVSDPNSAVNDNSINTANATNVRIGKAPWGSRWFTGLIDDARIYDRALSQAQIQLLYRVNLAWAWNPNPMNGTTGIARTPILTWTGGDYATSHYVFFGTDEDALPQVAGPQAATSYNPDILDLGTTYYWRIVESPGMDPGRIWKFTTMDYLVIDDMDAYVPYDNAAGPHIFVAWRDGKGDCDGSGNDTGANLLETTPALFAGSQLMQYDWDNDGYVFNPCTGTPDEFRPNYYSKIVAQVAGLPSGIGSNWTAGGVKALSLLFYGDTLNSINDPLWVQLSDSGGAGEKVEYGTYADESLADIQDPAWHEWLIDLNDFDVQLTNVVSIAIGIGDEDATGPHISSGTLYFDDVRLYTPRCIASRNTGGFADADYAPVGDPDCVVDYKELKVMGQDWAQSDYNIYPAAPDPAGLVASYQFENNANDSSPNGIHGLEGGFPAYVAGQVGQAIDLNGIGDFVDIDNANIVTGNMSIALWMMPRNLPYPSDYRSIFHNNAWNAGSLHGHLRANTSLFNVDINSGKGISSTTAAVSDQWYHVVVTVDFDNGETKIYVDGVLENTNTSGGTAMPYLGPLNIGAYQDGSRFFDGLMDDFRIYDYALDENEVVATRGLGTVYVPVTSPANISDDEPATEKKVNFLDYAELMDFWGMEQEWPAW